MKTKEKFIPENVIVTPIDREKLNAEVDRYYKEKYPECPDRAYETQGRLAIMTHPKKCVIDEEFIGHDIDNDISFYIYCHEGNVYECLPRYEITFSLQELAPFVNEGITLAEHTKRRRGYNSRIQNNEREWIKYLNS